MTITFELGANLAGLIRDIGFLLIAAFAMFGFYKMMMTKSDQAPEVGKEIDGN